MIRILWQTKKSKNIQQKFRKTKENKNSQNSTIKVKKEYWRKILVKLSNSEKFIHSIFRHKFIWTTITSRSILSLRGHHFTTNLRHHFTTNCFKWFFRKKCFRITEIPTRESQLAESKLIEKFEDKANKLMEPYFVGKNFSVFRIRILGWQHYGRGLSLSSATLAPVASGPFGPLHSLRSLHFA